MAQMTIIHFNPTSSTHHFLRAHPSVFSLAEKIYNYTDRLLSESVPSNLIVSFGLRLVIRTITPLIITCTALLSLMVFDPIITILQVCKFYLKGFCFKQYKKVLYHRFVIAPLHQLTFLSLQFLVLGVLKLLYKDYFSNLIVQQKCIFSYPLLKKNFVLSYIFLAFAVHVLTTRWIYQVTRILCKRMPSCLSTYEFDTFSEGYLLSKNFILQMKRYKQELSLFEYPSSLRTFMIKVNNDPERLSYTDLIEALDLSAYLLSKTTLEKRYRQLCLKYRSSGLSETREEFVILIEIKQELIHYLEHRNNSF